MPAKISKRVIEGLVGQKMSKAQYKALDDSVVCYLTKVLQSARQQAIQRAGNAQRIELADLRTAVDSVLR